MCDVIPCEGRFAPLMMCVVLCSRPRRCSFEKICLSTKRRVIFVDKNLKKAREMSFGLAVSDESKGRRKSKTSKGNDETRWKAKRRRCFPKHTLCRQAIGSSLKKRSVCVLVFSLSRFLRMGGRVSSGRGMANITEFKATPNTKEYTSRTAKESESLSFWYNLGCKHNALYDRTWWLESNVNNERNPGLLTRFPFLENMTSGAVRCAERRDEALLRANYDKTYFLGCAMEQN